ncbi:MAG: hypothetical protein V3V21_09700 [Thermoplasmata archaeon]
MSSGWKEIKELLLPRLLDSLSHLPNYIRDGGTLEAGGRELEFHIEDSRGSHDTGTIVSGLGSEDVRMYGFAILLARECVLLEVWNDHELNCWAEYDLSTRQQIFIRRQELGPFLEKYVSDEDVRGRYMEEIDPDFSTDALRHRRYYFASEWKEDRRMLLEMCGGLSLAKTAEAVNELAWMYFRNNSKDGTWRGVCVLQHAYQLYLKGTELEPEFLARIMLIGNTAVDWDAHPQEWYINESLKFLPFVTSLFERSDEAFRETELWDVMMSELLIPFLSRKWHDEAFEKAQSLFVTMKNAQEAGAMPREVTRLFMKGLLKGKLLTREEAQRVKTNLKLVS